MSDPSFSWDDENVHIFQEPADSSDHSCSLNTLSPLPISIPSYHISPSSQGSDISTVASPDTPLTPETPGISRSFFSLDLDSPMSSSPSFATPKRKVGRPLRKKGGFTKGHKYYPVQKPVQTSSQESNIPSSTSKIKLPKFRGYSSRCSAPPRLYDSTIEFRTANKTSKRKAHIPKGNRIIDISILADVFSSLHCSHCGHHLVLYEEPLEHGWQCFFRLKCYSCHLQVASFPSSRPLRSNPTVTCVDQPKIYRVMNETTMRSVLSTHATGMSWRDLHRFSTIFDLPQPVAQMPGRYLSLLETKVKSAVSSSIQFACEELRNLPLCEPSAEPNATNITVSFDSSWHTRGFYSNLGFGAAISTDTKKVVDYEILSRTCERCAIWTDERKDNKPLEFARWNENHKEHCNRNFTGSSQRMEPEGARRIWSRSLARNLCYNIFVGDGDSKSFHEIRELNPYPLVDVQKEECLTHVAKRVKKHLKNIKANTKNTTYVQHKLTEWKADYIASNYSTVVLQHRGSTPGVISQALETLVKHSAGEHTNCPQGDDSWCRWSRPSTIPPTAVTTFTPNDIQKVKEVFQLFASEDFCSHVTLALTQNANESLHNKIWSLCPKSKYVSVQSVRISTALAILQFNDTELALYALMQDLELHPTSNCYYSICRREEKLAIDRKAKAKSNLLRRRRRKRLTEQAREAAFIRAEGGATYRGGKFGAEHKRKIGTSAEAVKGKPPTKRAARGTKRKITRPLSDTSSDASSQVSSTDSDTLCTICNNRLPNSVALRSVVVRGRRKMIADWVECTVCSDWIHCYCADIDVVTAESRDYACHKH